MIFSLHVHTCKGSPMKLYLGSSSSQIIEMSTLLYPHKFISDYNTIDSAGVGRNMGDMDALRRSNADMNV